MDGYVDKRMKYRSGYVFPFYKGNEFEDGAGVPLEGKTAFFFVVLHET